MLAAELLCAAALAVHGGTFPPPPPPPPSPGAGGRYDGPGDTVAPPPTVAPGAPPPMPGATGPTTPTPTPGSSTPGSGAPAPAGTPSSPGGRGPSTPSAPATPASAGGADVLDWSHWWNLERDLYLWDPARLQSPIVASGAGERLRSRAQIGDDALFDRVVPMLLEVLATEREDDLRTAALVALGKTGDRLAGEQLEVVRAALRAAFRDDSQEVAETAVLSLGILGDPRDVPVIVEVLTGSEAGAKAVQRGDVPERTRAFAGYALAVLGEGSVDVGAQQRIAAAAIAMIEVGSAHHDVAAASAIALGLCRLPGQQELPPADVRAGDHAEDVVSRDAASRWLTRRVMGRGSLPPTVRAHMLAATARLARGTSESVRGEALEVLADAAVRSGIDTRERAAAVIGLGELARSREADDAAFEALSEALRRGQSLERRMAAIAIAHASTRPPSEGAPLERVDEGRAELVRALRAGRNADDPWCALALGVHVHHARALGEDPTGRAMGLVEERIARARSASTVGAYAIAASLASVGASGDEIESTRRDLRRALGRTHDPVARGHVVLALGMLGTRDAAETLSEVLDDARFQPQLLWNAAVGLHLIKDGDVTARLSRMMRDASANVTRAAIASAIGRVGDPRALDPLMELAEDDDAPAIARAFAVVGIGTLAEDRRLPWRVPLAHALPYFAPTQTLWGGGNGVLDVL